MKIGVISDIHANLEALEAVLSSLETDKVDRIVCLGDIVGYGANPKECCEIIMSVCDVCVIGNHDAAIIGRMDYSYYYDAAHMVLDWTKTQLTDRCKEYLLSLPYFHEYEGVLLCHGSPIDAQNFEYIFSIEQAKTIIPYFEQLKPLTLIGHSHLFKTFAYIENEVNDVLAQKFGLRKNYKYIISAGSVGQPRDYDPRAGYGIYNTEMRTFEIKRVEYNIEKAASKITSSGLPNAFAKRLFMGL
ncbi:MAG: metallophosphatase family protein [Deltaproteobacteria bacterium]|nr:metallophosphatase family protein [Deltaproteobacteria bacterium]